MGFISLIHEIESKMTFDRAGKHPMDRIEIRLPNGPSFLNDYKNADGTPKDVSLD